MQMVYHTCHMALILSNIACYTTLLYSVKQVLHGKGVMCQIWVLLLYSSDPEFQM